MQETGAGVDFAVDVVAFDIDYDDFANVCDKLNHYRAFTRLYTLTDYVEYFQPLANNVGELKYCLDLGE
ncbi:hypothetical protein MRX96_014824 [Rhipicephalus microplus]